MMETMFPEGAKVRITRHEDQRQVGRVGYITFAGYATGERATLIPTKAELPMYVLTEQPQGRVGGGGDFAGAALCYETQIEAVTDDA